MLIALILLNVGALITTWHRASHAYHYLEKEIEWEKK